MNKESIGKANVLNTSSSCQLIINVKYLGLKHHYFDYHFSYSFDPLPGVEDCGQRTENEESLYAPRIAGIIIILESLDYCKILKVFSTARHEYMVIKSI